MNKKIIAFLSIVIMFVYGCQTLHAADATTQLLSDAHKKMYAPKKKKSTSSKTQKKAATSLATKKTVSTTNTSTSNTPQTSSSNDTITKLKRAIASYENLLAVYMAENNTNDASYIFGGEGCPNATNWFKITYQDGCNFTTQDGIYWEFDYKTGNAAISDKIYNAEYSVIVWNEDGNMNSKNPRKRLKYPSEQSQHGTYTAEEFFNGSYKTKTNIPQSGGNDRFQNSNISTSNQVDFEPYMRDLQRDIKRNWDPPKGNESKRVVVLFSIAKNGNLLGVKISKSSGSQASDRAAIIAIEETAPFKPLPSEYKKSSVDIQFTFDYNVYGVSGY